MTSQRHHLVDDDDVWLGVHDASSMIGVSPATLRRWSAAGKIAVFTTPGGHRRYSRSMLQQLLPQATGWRPSASALGESSERVVELVVRQLREPGGGISWVERADEDTQRLVAVAGRAMVDGLLGYIDKGTDSQREDALRPAIEAAALQGRVMARQHGDLGETMEASHRFRGLLVDDLGRLACRHALATADTTRILARVNDGVDRLIVALVAAHLESWASDRERQVDEEVHAPPDRGGRGEGQSQSSSDPVAPEPCQRDE